MYTEQQAQPIRDALLERTVQHLLDAEWVEVITEHLHTYPHSIALVIEANCLGQFDCEQGLPCDPYARGYTTPDDVNAYMQAYTDCASLWAGMVDEINCGLDDDHSDETLDYIEDMLDREYWRRGEY